MEKRRKPLLKSKIEEEAIPIHEPRCDVDAVSERDEEENVTGEIRVRVVKKVNFCGGIDNCIKDDYYLFMNFEVLKILFQWLRSVHNVKEKFVSNM